MKKFSPIACLCGVMIGLGGSAFAHHSPAVFDRTKEVKLVGVVKEFRWSNPHSFIELNVRNDKGEIDTWAVEMNPPGYLVKAGWKSTTVKPGDEVTVVIHPLRTSEAAGQFVSITLSNGQVLSERASAPPPQR
ncbi:MAG TPA: DUF6152 family protein [Terriglobia bacterium]|nr:DUF6152 family protein [Terriglobia bacterium]